MTSYGDNLFCKQLRLDGQTPIVPGKWLTVGVVDGSTSAATATVADADFTLGQTNYLYCVLSTPASPVSAQTLTIQLPNRFDWGNWIVELNVQYPAAPTVPVIYEIIEQTTPSTRLLLRRTTSTGGNMSGVDNTKLYFKVLPRAVLT